MSNEGKINAKLTEDRTIKFLIDHLVFNSQEIESYCLGQQRGYDIVAKKNKQFLYIEVKGAKASDNSPTKKRKYFSSGQIKDHFGKAIVKSLETINAIPNAHVAIAHPDDKDIRHCIEESIKLIGRLGIIHLWVSEKAIQIVGADETILNKSQE